MKQTLHIFAKDARRFWPEIAVSLAITTLFARIYPNQWLTQAGLYAVSGWGGFAGAQGLQLLASVLTVLVPVGWLLLIARVIHGESLVGDRQFWLTRPYEWKKLLAAKVLFLVVFLYLPFVIAQLALLAEAGFRPFAYLPPLLFNLLLVTGALVMPLFALATVTSTFVRMVLAVVGILLGLVCFSVLASGLATGTVSVSIGPDFSIPILVCLCGGAVVVQHATRRLWFSRLLLIGLFLAIGVAMVIPSDGGTVDRAFAARARNQEFPLQIKFLHDASHQVTGVPVQGTNRVQINIPVQISGIPNGIVIMPQYVRVSGNSANVAHWSMLWQPLDRLHYLSDTQDSSISFMMDRSIYEKVKAAPIQLKLTLASTQGQAGEATKIPLPTADFSIPGFGVCAPERGWYNAARDVTGIACRSAFRQPSLTYVETLWSNSPCSGAATEPDRGVQGAAWAGDFDTAPAQFGITSVWSVMVSLTNGWRYTNMRDRPQEPRYLCAGTPVVFTRYHMVKRFETEVVIPNFQMPTKATPEGYVEATP
jgi:hypothetical protein